MNEDLALNYLSRLEQLMEANRWTQADILLGQAMEFSMGLSGLWSAKARIENQQNLYGQALLSSFQAMELDQWQGSSYLEAAAFHSELLLQLKEYEAHNEWYQRLPEMLRWNRHILYDQCFSLWKTEAVLEAIDLARRGLSLYPWDSRFQTILLLQDDPAELARFDRHWGQQPQRVDQVFYPLLGDTDFPYWNYYQEHSNSPWSAHRPNFFWSVDAMESFLQEYHDLNDLALIKEIYENSDEESRSLISDWLMTKNREFLWDQDFDGHSEGRLVIEDQTMEFFWDVDQNGLWEVHWLYSWDSSDLGLLESQNAYERRSFTFQYWPYIDQAQIIRETERRVYFFRDKEFLSTLNPSQSWLELLFELPSLGHPLEETQLLEHAYRLEQFREGHLFRVYFVDQGRVFYILEDSDGSRVPDRLLRVENGFSQAGLRDIDEDGHMDLYEHYSRGTWQALIMNRGEGFHNDYLEAWEPIEIQLWDFNPLNGWNSGFNKEENPPILLERDPEGILLESTPFGEQEYEKYWGTDWDIR